jgi:hypothetical protein
MPDISREVGVVIHLPAGEARCTIYTVDIAAGWEAFQMSMATRKWRATKTLATPYQFSAETGTVSPVTDDTPSAMSPPPSPLTLDPVDQLARVAANPLEGADGGDVQWLKDAQDTLDDADKSWLKELRIEAKHGHVSFMLNEAVTARRIEITRGLIQLCRAGDGNDGILREVLSMVIGDVAHFANVKPGHLVGSLDVHEARRFADLCTALADGAGVLFVNADGSIALEVA